MIMNQTQPRLLSQPHCEGKRTQSAQIALRSFGANSKNALLKLKWKHRKQIVTENLEYCRLALSRIVSRYIKKGISIN